MYVETINVVLEFHFDEVMKQYILVWYYWPVM